MREKEIPVIIYNIRDSMIAVEMKDVEITFMFTLIYRYIDMRGVQTK